MIKDFNVGVKGIVCVNNKCLLLKANRGDNVYWDISGGRIDDNETLEETITRELSEELPTLGKYRIGDVVGAHRLSKNLPEGQGLVLIFYKIEAEEFEVNLSEEHIDYRWVSKDELEELQNGDVYIEPGYSNAIAKALS